MIEVRNLSYHAGNREILKDIDLTLETGEFAAVIGPNGAGKSTLIKTILGIINDYKGEILIDGIEASKWRKNNIIGYLPQKEQFDRDFPATAMDIVLMGIAGKRGLFRHFTSDDRKQALDIMDMMDVARFKDSYIGTLSGGEMQRVLISRAIMTQSDYLFLDEPEAGVDKKQITDFYNRLTELNKTGKTILIISHDIGMINKFSNFMICINRKLHCHSTSDLVNAEIIKETYGDVMQIIHKEEY